MLPIELNDSGEVSVEGEVLGLVEGLRFKVDSSARHEDRRMLLAAAEKALPKLLGTKADQLVAADMEGVELARGAIRWKGEVLAELERRDGSIKPLLKPSREVSALPENARHNLMAGLEKWLDKKLQPLEPLEKMHHAASNPDAGSQARALLLNLIAGHGYVTRDRAGIEHLPKEMRPFLRKIGVTFGALDVFAPALLKPAPRQLLNMLGVDRRPLQEAMLPVIAETKKLPSGYRAAGTQAIRIDLAEKILRAAHETRAKAQSKDRRRKFVLDYALPISIGLEEDNISRLLGNAGFRVQKAKPLPEGQFGPPRPDRWEWRPSRRKQERPTPMKPREGSAFAALADLVRT